jgi:hypothetical protein
MLSARPRLMSPLRIRLVSAMPRACLAEVEPPQAANSQPASGPFAKASDPKRTRSGYAASQDSAQHRAHLSRRNLRRDDGFPISWVHKVHQRFMMHSRFTVSWVHGFMMFMQFTGLGMAS